MNRHYGEPQHYRGLVALSETPSAVCWIIPELDPANVDGRFWRDWCSSNSPRVIYLHRDPRATLISMINCLSNATGRGYGDYADFVPYSEILLSKPTMHDRIEFALPDPNFPGAGSHESMRWLLDHPRVLSISFDELVGVEGGGSREAQERVIRRVAAHLDLDPQPGLQSKIYSTATYTFHRGHRSAWGLAYSPGLLLDANQRFRHILGTYGYAESLSLGSVVESDDADLARALRAVRTIKAGEVVLDLRDCGEQQDPTRLSMFAGNGRHLDAALLARLNHSCAPNVIVDIPNLEVKADRQIEPGEMLTFFYPSTEWEQVEAFDCKRGDERCLDRISGASALPAADLKTYYLNPHILDHLQQTAPHAS